jgi:CBS domain-containing protein
MTLQEILNAKGTLVHKIAPDQTLADVVRRLTEQRVGSLIVCEPEREDRMVGIITERDVLRAISAGPVVLDQLKVRDYMTRKPITGSPLDEVAEVMGLMTNRRIRHLPVMDGQHLVGIISIGDVVKAQYDQMVMENHYLKSYLNGGISADVI